MQFEPLKRTLQMLHQEGIHVAMENNGTCVRVSELLSYIDLLIIDLKHIDDEVHKAWTGVSNMSIRNNITNILESGKRVWIRMPLVHGFNDDIKEINKYIDFYKNNDCRNASFEFLSYHEYGKSKWQQCGLPYMIKNGFVDNNVREKFEEAYKNAGLHVIHT